MGHGNPSARSPGHQTHVANVACKIQELLVCISSFFLTLNVSSRPDKTGRLERKDLCENNYFFPQNMAYLSPLGRSLNYATAY